MPAAKESQTKLGKIRGQLKDGWECLLTAEKTRRPAVAGSALDDAIERIQAALEAALKARRDHREQHGTELGE
jgi:hypothetical protein